METLEAEERMKECGSRGEFGDVDVVAGGGAGNQDQEARAQKCRREHGEEERRHRRGACERFHSCGLIYDKVLLALIHQYPVLKLLLPNSLVRSSTCILARDFIGATPRL